MSGHQVAARSHGEEFGTMPPRTMVLRLPPGTDGQVPWPAGASLLADTPQRASWGGSPEPSVPALPPLQEFHDYRDYLLAYYSWKRSMNHRFSYRMLASRWLLDVSFVYRVLHRKNHLALNAVDRVARAIGLDADGSRYFAQLVHRGRMTSEPGRNGVRIAAGNRMGHLAPQ